MHEQHHAFLLAAVILACGCVGITETSRADEGAGQVELTNPFFAMNFARRDPRLASSQEAQAELLKELGDESEAAQAYEEAREYYTRALEEAEADTKEWKLIQEEMAKLPPPQA